MDYKNKHTYILVGILFLVFGCILFFGHAKSAPTEKYSLKDLPACGDYQKGIVHAGEASVSVDISDTECKRDLGLSGRDTLPDGDGMIFIFDVAGNYPFWMQDMNFPLDMVWVSSDFVVTGIEKNVSPDTYDAQNPSASGTFGGEFLAQYVLELPAGYTSREDIEVGNKITFSEKSLQ